ncbi:MAG: hypothetical protein Q8O04_09795 [Deltaproteobacteria bacterium]|nr:hypothetical protein [Deltaproteobacteria bacterium]
MTKSRNFAKMLVIMFVVFLGSVNVALAVPTLQLYMPGAKYFAEYYVDDEYKITEAHRGSEWVKTGIKTA